MKYFILSIFLIIQFNGNITFGFDSDSEDYGDEGCRFYLDMYSRAAPQDVAIDFKMKEFNDFNKNYLSFKKIIEYGIDDYDLNKLFEKLKKELSQIGISFYDPILLKEIETGEQLYLNLQSNFNYQGKANDLKNIVKKLLIHIKLFKNNIGIDFTKIKLNSEALKTRIDIGDKFSTQVSFINKNIYDENLKRLFVKLSKVITKDLLYLDKSENDLENDLLKKKKYLAYFFNKITLNEKFIEDYPGYGDFFGSYQSRSKEYKSEITYKMSKIASKSYDNIQLKNIAKSLIHAGKKCADAIKYQVDVLFLSFYPNEYQEILDNVSYMKRDLYAQSYILAQKLKGQVLNNLIIQYIPSSSSEGVTIFAATWDKFAGSLGLVRKGGAYFRYTLRDDQLCMNDILKEYTCKLLVREYVSKNKDRIKSSFAGILSNYFDLDNFVTFISVGELVRFGLLDIIKD